MSSPLKGIRVLELGQFIAGPFMGLQLADLGAEVIKIEKPGEGEPFRVFGANPKMAGYSHNFCAFNRNKLSVTVDLAKPRGAELFRAMAAKADVVLENFRSGVMQRLGIDYDVLKKLNPRLVYGSIVGFAEDGPNRGQPAYDTVAQAMSGMLTLFLDPDDPRIIGPTIADQVTGMQAAAAVIAALYERERTGKGARIDITLVEASMYLMPDTFTAYTHAGLAMGPESRAAFSLSLAFACKDGMVAMHVSSIEKFWRAMLAAVERSDLADDPRFKDRASRIKNFQTLIEVLRPVFAEKPRDPLMARMAANQVPCAKVNSVPEAMNDPEVRHLGLFHEIAHPRYGKMTAMRRSVRIDGAREADPKPPPALGEHTDKVLGDIGIQAAEIGELRANGII
ncbi:MAG TPA: CaiB/BaiF CoA-transferase family protein [Alphaproteobacteria bacterium]|jgi:formyl-CoA transferase